MHRVYKLHPHKHTGKLIHHRHTSYPVLIALILIVGALIGLTGRIASADDLLVTATVPAPIPAGVPTFTAPAEGTLTNDPSIDFRGTCPVITPAVIIALYEGSTLLGSGICDADGTFRVTASFTSGTHTIIATVVTITGDTGGSSAPLTITYTPPTSAMPPSSTAPVSPNTPPATRAPEAGEVAPLDIISGRPFLVFDAHLRTEWRGHFAGGIAPYTVKIAWGDGTVDSYDVKGDDEQYFTHTYSANRLYTVSITVKDRSGLALTRYYVAMRTNGAPIASTDQHSFTTLLDSPIVDPLWATWLIYLCLLVTMLLMWRHEHIHYPRGLIGLPLRYSWQHAIRSKKHTKS